MTALVQPIPTGWPSPSVLFARVADRPGAFFLDSAWRKEGNSQYSFIGFEPFLHLVAEAGGCRMTEGDGPSTEKKGEEPLTTLRTLLRRYRTDAHSLFPFTGGAVGYFSYELGASWERVEPRSALTCPDFEFSFYDGLLAFDHRTEGWSVIANPVHTQSAAEIVRMLVSTIEEALKKPAPRFACGQSLRVSGLGTKESYLASVQAIKNYIRSGDVYQANLAHTFEGQWRGHPYLLYEQLRKNTPAPFGAYLRTRFGHLLSCSPERFFQLRGDCLETRPIKGTRRRGAETVEDAKQRADLVASAKERAELLMIVDLERNDLGKVCRPGSIAVNQLYGVETHPTVFHLVATIVGQLRPNLDVIDVVRALFPGGSITGAPKIRAMQIIRELEKTARGPYTGAIGYFGFDGGADFNIAIRTVELRGEHASYQVGAGIVWDSDPESEYEETLAKGRALEAALGGIQL